MRIRCCGHDKSSSSRRRQVGRPKELIHLANSRSFVSFVLKDKCIASHWWTLVHQSMERLKPARGFDDCYATSLHRHLLTPFGRLSCSAHEQHHLESSLPKPASLGKLFNATIRPSLWTLEITFVDWTRLILSIVRKIQQSSW